MSNITNLTIYDGQSTPVLKTFEVANTQSLSEPARWFEKSAGVKTGYSEITASSRRSKSKIPVTRYVYKVTLPLLAQTAPSSSTGIQPLPTVALTCVANIEFIIPDAAPQNMRDDLAAYVNNLFGEALLISMIKGDVSIY